MKDTPSNEDNVNLLWTGGWDSTFQLLQLLIIQRRPVTPFYLIDADRRSTGLELRTIARIKARLLREYPYVSDLLEPTQYFAMSDVSPNGEITDAHEAIARVAFMPTQYEWLARFCKELGITDMQLCVHSERRHHDTHFDFGGCISECADGVHRVEQGPSTVHEHRALGCFSFPIITHTKVEMSDIAKEQGLTEIMGMTWFCRSPRKKMTPCGRCGPCIQAIEEGVGWRIPMRGRAAAVLQRSINLPLRSLAKAITRKLGLLDRIRWHGLQKRAQREARNR